MIADSDEAVVRAPDAPPPPGSPIRVVIADDHDLYRQSLRIVLSLDGDIEVVGEASSGREAVEACRSLRPDVLVMDVQMPRLGGVAALEQVIAEVPEVRVVMLTMSDEHQDFLAALRAGGRGYLLKDAPGELAAACVRRVHGGGIAVSESVVAALLNYLSGIDPDDFASPQIPHLIERLRSIVRRLGTRTAEEAEADRAGANPEFTTEVMSLLESFRSLPQPARDTTLR